MKLLNTCEKCGGSLHPVYDMPGKFYCPSCKMFFERYSSGWKEVHA